MHFTIARPAPRRWTALVTAAAVAASGLVVTATVAATPAHAVPVTYPWSQVAATNNYIADVYNEVGADHVFENVTTDRLLDILSSNGNYYIVFAGPEHPASQALLETINAQAKAKGITKIYHFDPYVDGYQLDVTTTPGGVDDVTGGTSVNFGGTAKLSDVWKLITNLLPASTVAAGGALAGYTGDTATLLNVNISDRKNVESGKVVTKLAQVTAAEAADFAADTAGVRTATATALGSAFDGKSSAVRSQWQFFERLYNASATKTEGGTASADRIGGAVEVFAKADYPAESDFRLKSIDLKELYNLLNSPGEVPILFAGQGCHNTQAIIGSVAKRAKELDLPVVYVVDLALDSNVKFGTGESIDVASANSATGGLWVRSGSAALATTSPYRYGYSYLYGKVAEYFGPNWITENSSKKSNSVAYYPNAVLGEASTVNTFAAGYAAAAGDKANATRLQVPTIVRYNKDAANPVVGHWLHADKVASGVSQTYTEYMLELAWVRQTAPALADAGRSTGRDGLTKVEFAAEAVAALDNVLKANTSVTHQFTTTPAPTVTGTAAAGSKLEGFWDAWSHNANLTFQWQADGQPIAGATSDTYTVTDADAGKQITFALTGSRPNYASVTKVSAALAIPAPATQTATPTATPTPTPANPGTAFTTAPTPKVKGTVKIGKTLKAVPDTWKPAASLSYQWNADGAPIGGARKATFKLQPAQVGKKITVTVTGAKPGFASTAKTSVATKAVPALPFKKGKPKVSGSAVVGKVLTAKAGAWSPKAGTVFSYQWFAQGVAIDGAITAKLTLTAAQSGKRITVRVSAAKLGYASASKVAKATKPVK